MHPGAGFSDATHLDERDHVAQGFVHLLQSALPLLGGRAVVVAFHIDALVVHCGHLSTAIAGGGREGEAIRGRCTWGPPGCRCYCPHRHIMPQNPIFCFQPVLSYLLWHRQARYSCPESPDFAWDSHQRCQVENAMCKHRLSWQPPTTSSN